MPEPATDAYQPSQDQSLASTGDFRCDASSLGDTPATDSPLPDGDVRRGRFTILPEYFEGGMGRVNKARDEQLQRTVALKEIHPDLRGIPRLRKRFLREAAITGRLEHPGIVPVYALEEGPDGEPFCAMRLIQGQTLEAAIRAFHKAPDFASLKFRVLLQRFVSVCQTVAYAHSKGVIHRDLKPANIMLGDYGETLVLDWGLAKDLSEPRASASGDVPTHTSKATTGPYTPPNTPDATQLGEALGTPEYMSPEQAAGRWDVLDHGTDIYSLGATLYELLTGKPPYDRKENWPALQQKIQQGKFVRPRVVNKGVPAALEAICLKAMAVEPQWRYSSALDLAGDLEHWLADEPVDTYREPLLVRAGRWARKHKPVVATAAAILLTATMGLAGGLYFVNAEKNRTELARQGEERERIEAQTQEALANAAIDFVVNKVFAAARPKDYEGGQGYDVKLADAVKGSLPFVENSFKNQPLIEARLRMTLGASFRYLGKPEIAEAQYLRSRELYTSVRGWDHPDTLAAMMQLASSYAELGRHAEALRLFEETLALRKAKLGPDHPDTLASMNNLACIYNGLGRHDEALKLHQETLALRKAKLGPDHPDTLVSMYNQAVVYRALGQHTDALRLNEETLALCKAKFGPDHLETHDSMNNLATSYYALGRYADALKLVEETLALRKAKLGPDHPKTLGSMNNVASGYFALRRRTDALKLHEETLALRKAKLGPDHPETLSSMDNVANCQAALGRYAEALKLREETLALRKAKLGPDHPDTLASMNNLALSYSALGRHAEALKLKEETLALRKAKLGPDHPDTILSRFVLGLSWMQSSNYPSAEEQFLACEMAVASGRPGLHPDLREKVHPNLVKLYDAWGKPAEAERWFAKLPAEQKLRLGLERQRAWPLLWGWPRF